MADPPLDALVALLSSSDERDRLEGAYLIGERADRRATLALVKVIEAATTDRDRELRFVGARALGRLRDGRALPLLLALGRAREEGALEALGVLGRLAKKEGVPVLLAALAVPRARRVAGRALARLGSPGVERGRVTMFDAARGFGFVRPQEGKTLFFHGRDWDANEPAQAGIAVSFYALRDLPKPCAVRVRALARAPAAVLDPSLGVEATGVVQWFDPAKGYGFVTRDGTGESTLVRTRDIEDAREPRALRARERVRFLAVPTTAGLRGLHVHAETAPSAG